MNKLYGLIGEKLSHSISPQIHSLIFKELGIEGFYNLFEVNTLKLKDAVIGLKALNVNGVNVTIPYKVSIMNYLEEVSKEAKKIGAVNTVCFNQDKAVGYNTDYYGFGMMLKKYDVNIFNKNVMVLGSGGAAKSVIAYFMDNGVKNIYVVSRNAYSMRNIYKDNLNYFTYNELNKCNLSGNLNDCDILVNCTPCGMYPNIDTCALEKPVIANFNTVIDLVYNPTETILLKYAKENGSKTINGLYMLIGQAVAAQELWNSVKIHSETVDKIHNYFTNKI